MMKSVIQGSKSHYTQYAGTVVGVSTAVWRLLNRVPINNTHNKHTLSQGPQVWERLSVGCEARGAHRCSDRAQVCVCEARDYVIVSHGKIVRRVRANDCYVISRRGAENTLRMSPVGPVKRRLKGEARKRSDVGDGKKRKRGGGLRESESLTEGS
jgi:hypothetical protein